MYKRITIQRYKPPLASHERRRMLVHVKLQLTTSDEIFPLNKLIKSKITSGHHFA